MKNILRMKLYEAGDKSKAICSHCASIVTTTFKRRDVPFSDGKGMVRDILVAVCDTCDTVVAIPAQSTPPIQAARQKVVKPLELNLPAVYIDMLDLAAYSVDAKSTSEFRKTLVTLYVHKFATGQYEVADLLRANEAARAQYKVIRGTLRRRLSMKVSPTIEADVKALMHDTSLSKTDVLTSIIYRIQSDVLDSKKPALLRELSTLSAISA